MTSSKNKMRKSSKGPEMKGCMSSIEASKKFSITKDYIASLCRQGRVTSRKINGSWYVETEALASYLLTKHYYKALRRETLTFDRKQEYSKLATVLATKDPVFSTGILHAAANVTSHLPAKANIAAHMLSPLSDIFHKLIGLAVAICAAFGVHTILDSNIVSMATVNSFRDYAHGIQRVQASFLNDDIETFTKKVRIQVASATLSIDKVSTSEFAPIIGIFAYFASSFNEAINAYVYSIVSPDPSLYSNSAEKKDLNGRVSVKISSHYNKNEEEISKISEGLDFNTANTSIDTSSQYIDAKDQRIKELEARIMELEEM